MSELFFQALVSGIEIGLVYGIVAVGMLLVFAVGHVINLAHGEVMTIGMYLGLLGITFLRLPYVVVLILVPLMGFAIGVVFERIGYRPFHRAAAGSGGHEGLLMIFISTLALSLALTGALTLIVPTEGSGFPPVLPILAYKVGPIRLAPSDILIGSISILSALAMAAFLRLTQVGRSMRAIAQNPAAASLMGINSGRISSLGWGLSALLAALAGVLLGPGSVITPYSGGGFLFIAFAAAVLGGFGSIEGALIGGLILGLSQAFFSAYVSTGWSGLVAFGMLIVVLLVRPQGLFGFSVERV
jgi:branched-chain amino acid transport system permease protein